MTRVLVADDSALMRRLLRRLLAEEHGFETAFAANGAEALALLGDFKPDVITLDINMPGMDGLECLDRIMLERPTPVIMLSSLTAAGAAQSVEALALGAVDVLQKPDGAVSLGIEALGLALIEKIKAAASIRLRRTHRLAERVRHVTRGNQPPPQRDLVAARPKPVRTSPLTAIAGAPRGVVLVGCSTGGPAALDALLAPLPADFPWPIVVAQHMPVAFTGPLARRLDGLCALEVVEAAQATPLAPGRVCIGRGDADVVVAQRSQGLVAMPAPSSADYAWHPSVDRLVESAMAAMPASGLMGVLMTGMGDDGAAAMTALRAAGGWCLAEAKETAVVWGMPGELVRAGGADEIAPVDALAERLVAQVSVR
jgi:two-component system, chemotaxis family, protein-glutamate methylesterase/glutaminase